MKEYKPLQIKKYAKKSYKHPEMRRFKKFSEDKNLNLRLTCNKIKICKNNPNIITYFVLDSIYHLNMINDNTITKYPQCVDVINAGEVRSDGRIIYTGLMNGNINVYDANKKNILKQYNSHKLQVNSIQVSENSVNFISVSNDLSLKVFDLTNFEPVRTYNKAHLDYPKIAKYLNESTLISGGYDKTVKLWDIRSSSKEPVKTFKNNNICNDILVINGEKFISSAENCLNLFDIRSDSPISVVNPVQGIISNLIADSNNTRLFIVSAGESFVKVADLSDISGSGSMRSLYSIKLGKEISAFDISEDTNRYAAAFVSGEISIRSRNFDIDDEDIYREQEEKDFELLDPTKYSEKDVVKNYKYFNRGQYEKLKKDSDELTVMKEKKKKLQDYDQYFKKFQYHLALDSVLKKNNVEIIVTVIEELIDRNTLKLALLNRSEEELEILLTFILWKIREPKLMNLLLYIFNLIVDYYIVMWGKSPKIDKLFKQISEALKEEIEFEKKLIDIEEKFEKVNNLSKYSY